MAFSFPATEYDYKILGLGSPGGAPRAASDITILMEKEVLDGWEPISVGGGSGSVDASLERAVYVLLRRRKKLFKINP